MHGRHRLIEGLIAVILCASAPLASAQVPWVRSPGNPVLAPGVSGSWDESAAVAVTVIFHQGIYKMWYAGDNGLGYATSADGLAWTKHVSNPVLLPGTTGSWDEDTVDHASVIYADGLYRMWYIGNGVDAFEAFRIGYATSPDGVMWTKYAGNPVLDLGPPGSMDDEEVFHPWVIYEGGLYRMWYNGRDGSTQRILYASSPDGITWTKFTAHPMLEAGAPGSWDDKDLGPLCVVASGALYHMWYSGWDSLEENFAIGHAVSSDGLDWTKTTWINPVLTQGNEGSWDDSLIAVPIVLLEGGAFRMWYAGTDGGIWQTGHATAPDLTDVPEEPGGSADGAGLCKLYQNAPNPFRASTTIRYAVAVSTSVRLEVIDLAGRRVRLLVSGDEVEAGSHVASWDGRDDAGRKLGAGLYFCRLESLGAVRSRRMVLIR
jgi:hypothetical protein